MSNIPELNVEKQKLFKILNETNDNAFITGRAGTGKSLLLEYFVKHTNKKCVVVAPTGVAALNIGGQTIHSLFSFDIDVQDPNKHRHGHMPQKLMSILRSVDTIVIDEVSMVRVDIMESINARCQNAKRSNEPFGGIQLICFGDLFQLPPVITDDNIRQYLYSKYDGEFFFDAPVFKTHNIDIYELEKVFRQKDRKFKTILNDIRVGNINDSLLQEINNRYIEPPKNNEAIILATRNDTVSMINKNELNRIDAPEFTYSANIRGKLKQNEYPNDEHLTLKVGAKIMMLVNDEKRRWVNGSLGTIHSLSRGRIQVNIEGNVYDIEPYVWDKYRYEYDYMSDKLLKTSISEFTQYPIKLAWAVTIHKSQGQTYNSVIIDMGYGAFDAGQTYVALSRCVSLNKLYLKSKITHNDIIVNQKILDFMNNAKIIR